MQKRKALWRKEILVKEEQWKGGRKVIRHVNDVRCQFTSLVCIESPEGLSVYSQPPWNILRNTLVRMSTQTQIWRMRPSLDIPLLLFRDNSLSLSRLWVSLASTSESMFSWVHAPYPRARLGQAQSKTSPYIYFIKLQLHVTPYIS